MSTDTGPAGVGRDGSTAGARARDATLRSLVGVDAVRAVALGGVALLVVSYLSVFYRFVDIVGSPATFLTVVAGTLVAATVLSGLLTVRRATLVALALLVVGLALYVVTLPRQPPLLPLATDALTLATGRSLLLVTNLDVWVLTVAPGPVFLTWYLALRRRYVLAVLAGGGMLSFLVLTSDASVVTALMGVVGAIVAVAVGDMERRDDPLATAESLAVVLAGMILLAGFAPVVPAGGAEPATVWPTFGGGGGGAGTVEGSLVDAGNRMEIGGSLSLSPAVRFRVQSEESAYWQVGSYDRYTGDGWVRTGQTRSFSARRRGPRGDSRRVDQTYTVIDELSVVPAAWKPVSVGDSLSDRVQVTRGGTFDVEGSLAANATYTVRSQVPVASAERLRTAGTDYPDQVTDRYTNLPASTPDRVGERTSRLTANADTPYETALIVERWLENARSYSLNVEAPDGNIADSFLFEMQAGYCTYFATTMVAMLRTQGIPARMAVGYTPGERVSEDEWVVRGLDAHAWVQVYFPGTGWVRFDPTPAGPRSSVEAQRLNSARENNRSGVDLSDTGGEEWTPTQTATPAPLTPRDDQSVGEGTGNGSTPRGQIPVGRRSFVQGSPGFNGTINGTAASAGGDDGGFFAPVTDMSREETTLVAILFIGLIAGVRRSGLTGRAYRAVWVRYQPREDPRTDAERAFERLEYVLERRHRPREPGETVRSYLADVGADERARQVSQIRERARYAGAVTREEADEAISLTDEVVGG